MTIFISSIALVVSIGGACYSIWKDTQATVDAGNAWRAKRRLEEAIVTHVRTLKTELRLEAREPNDLMKGRFLARATEDLHSALADGKAAGLPRVLMHQATRTKGRSEDFLTEWIMIEQHVADNLTRLPPIDSELSEGRHGDQQLPRVVHLDPGSGVLLLEGLILSRVVPLSRRHIRRSIRKGLSLTETETAMFHQLADSEDARI